MEEIQKSPVQEWFELASKFKDIHLKNVYRKDVIIGRNLSVTYHDGSKSEVVFIPDPDIGDLDPNLSLTDNFPDLVTPVLKKLLKT